MLRLLLKWLVSAVALIIVAYVVPGFTVSGIKAALIAALVIGLLNATIGLVLKVVTFPLTLLTLGIFWFVINAIVLELASVLVDGFDVRNFWWAFVGAIVLAIVNMLLHALIPDRRKD
jgi:putative membrane protein